jgi:hypothetical protein
MKAEISPSEESKHSKNKVTDPDEAVWGGFERGYITKGDKSSKEKPQDDRPQLPLWKRILYLGVVWTLWICSVYTVLFVNLLGTLVPLTAAQLLYVYWIRKNKLEWFPFQYQFFTWLHATSIYDIFFRKVNGYNNLLLYRSFAGFFWTVGVIALMAFLTSPILNLDEMVFIKGEFEGYEELSSSDNLCGDLILTFRRENGTFVKFWDLHKTTSKLKALEQTKGEYYDVWGEPNTLSMVPECRKFPSIRQIYGRGYQESYHKEYGEKASLWLITIAIFLMTCGGLCLLRIVWAEKRK